MHFEIETMMKSACTPNPINCCQLNESIDFFLFECKQKGKEKKNKSDDLAE
jgi:hypothetical protein